MLPQPLAASETESRQYVRDAEGVTRSTDGLDLDAELPPEATPTGYRSGDVQLWFGPDGGAGWAYLVRGDGTWSGGPGRSSRSPAPEPAAAQGKWS